MVREIYTEELYPGLKMKNFHETECASTLLNTIANDDYNDVGDILYRAYQILQVATDGCCSRPWLAVQLLAGLHTDVSLTNLI